MEASALSHASRRGLLARRSPLLRLQGDDKLVALVRAGNDSAFEVLWDRYRSRLLAYCRSIVRSSEDAEDVLQEVFVNAHAAMNADEREILVRPWLYRIARNRSLNHLRKPVPTGQDSMDIHLHAHGEDAHDDAERREKVRQLVADVKLLPETQRTALILREIDALSYDEIAQAMETTIPSVKSLLVRARISLAETSQARLLTCEEVRVDLAAAAEGFAKLDGPTRRHIRACEACQDFRKQLRADGKALAALSPIPLIALVHTLLGKLFGGAAGGGAATGGAAGTAATGSAAAGTAAVGTTAAGTSAAGVAGAAAATSGAIATSAGGGALLGGIGGAIGVKAAATAATAAIVTVGAVEVVRKPATEPVSAPAIVKQADAPRTERAERPAATPAPPAENARPEVQAVGVTETEPVAQTPTVPAAEPEATHAPAADTAATPTVVTVPADEATADPPPLVDSTDGREPPPVPADPGAQAGNPPIATGAPYAPPTSSPAPDPGTTGSGTVPPATAPGSAPPPSALPTSP